MYKNECKPHFTNYRRITLLSLFSVILEELFISRLRLFLEKHKLINEGQYRSRTNRPTLNAIIDAIEEITNVFQQKKHAVGIFVDFNKVFDTIDHSILINKLEQYGICDVARVWLKRYLSGRI